MRCSFCNSPIGVMTGLRQGRFCSPEHQELFEMREWLVAQGPFDHCPLAVYASDNPAFLIQMLAPLHGEVALPVHSPKPDSYGLRSRESSPEKAPSLDRPRYALCEAEEKFEHARRLPAMELSIDSSIGAIGGRLLRRPDRLCNVRAALIPEPAPGFRNSIRALPEALGLPRMSKTLKPIPPVVWRPWRARNWNDPVGPTIAPAAPISIGFSLPDFKPAPLARSGLGLVQVAPRKFEWRNTPMNRRPPCPGEPIPTPDAIPPVFHGLLRNERIDPLHQRAAPPQAACPSAPVLSAPAALPFFPFSIRSPKAAYVREKVVVMPTSRRPFEYQPSLKAFREFRISPLPTRALPVLTLAPREFPSEANA